MEYTEAQNHLLPHDAAVSLLMMWYHAYSMGRQWNEKLLSVSVKRNSHFGIKTQITCMDGSGKYLDLRKIAWQL